MEIAIQNRSTGLTDKRVAKLAAAINRQVQRDVIPVWGGAVRDVWVEFDMRPEAADWNIIFADTSDYPGAAGYHTFDDEGKPLAYVFLDNGFEPSTVLSHEVLEAIADPYVNEWATNYRDGYEYAIENCDPVQDRGYWIDDVLVSDFVYPSWFGFETGTKNAHRSEVDPFRLDEGGYLIRRRPGDQEQFVGATRHRSSAGRLAFRGVEE